MNFTAIILPTMIHLQVWLESLMLCGPKGWRVQFPRLGLIPPPLKRAKLRVILLALYLQKWLKGQVL